MIKCYGENKRIISRESVVGDEPYKTLDVFLKEGFSEAVRSDPKLE